MSEAQLQTETETDQALTSENGNATTRQQLMCRVIDVENALLTSFQRFVEEQKSTLEDMMMIAKEELSKMELFASQSDGETPAVQQ